MYQPYTQTENNIRSNYAFTRKPNSWDEVKETIHLCNLTEDERLYLEESPTYSAIDILDNDKWPLSCFNCDMPLMFVVKYNNIEYVVNTEGSDHCRYVAKLVRN